MYRGQADGRVAPILEDVGAPSSGEPLEEGPDREMVRLRELVAEHPRLPDGQVVALLAEVSEQGLDARPRRLLAQHHLWLVLDEVARLGQGQDAGDLFQDGTTALLKVVQGLAPHPQISPRELQEAIRRAVADTVRGALLEAQAARDADRRWAEDGERLALAAVALETELGRPASDLELAAHLGWTVDRTAQLRRAVDEARLQYDREMADVLGALEDPE